MYETQWLLAEWHNSVREVTVPVFIVSGPSSRGVGQKGMRSLLGSGLLYPRGRYTEARQKFGAPLLPRATRSLLEVQLDITAMYLLWYLLAICYVIMTGSTAV